MKKLISMLAAGALLAAAIPAGAQTADLYKSKCQVCHGADGRADTPAGKKLGSKDFHSPEVAKASDQELFEITKKGKEKMPGYDKKLTDDQIKDLIKYIRALK
ncbi:MAG TPA: cytochrome c [Verrucomicrobiae bacterium]|jgi:cytochrome c6|nr:cytochrome c [Verrucomicrobiae bacterium]